MVFRTGQRDTRRPKHRNECLQATSWLILCGWYFPYFSLLEFGARRFLAEPNAKQEGKQESRSE
jgi:hypothetical protein